MQDQVVTGSPSKEERNWAVIAHISAIVFIWSGIGSLIGPFVVWLLRKDDMPFAAEQAKEALNFQITCILLAIVCWILALILIGFVLLVVLCIVDVVLSIVAAMKVSEGVHYRYPFNLRLIR